MRRRAIGCDPYPPSLDCLRKRSNPQTGYNMPLPPPSQNFWRFSILPSQSSPFWPICCILANLSVLLISNTVTIVNDQVNLSQIITKLIGKFSNSQQTVQFWINSLLGWEVTFFTFRMNARLRSLRKLKDLIRNLLRTGWQGHPKNFQDSRILATILPKILSKILPKLVSRYFCTDISKTIFWVHFLWPFNH